MRGGMSVMSLMIWLRETAHLAWAVFDFEGLASNSDRFLAIGNLRHLLWICLRLCGRLVSSRMIMNGSPGCGAEKNR